MVCSDTLLRLGSGMGVQATVRIRRQGLSDAFCVLSRLEVILYAGMKLNNSL